MSPTPRLQLLSDADELEGSHRRRSSDLDEGVTPEERSRAAVEDARAAALGVFRARLRLRRHTRVLLKIRRVQRRDTKAIERIEGGVFEALGLAKRADDRARQGHASDVDLAQTIERERAAREAETARMREMLAPVVADASRRAGNSGATRTAGALSVAVVVGALAKEPVETVKVLREIGPTGAGIAVVLLLVALAWARFRRS